MGASRRLSEYTELLQGQVALANARNDELLALLRQSGGVASGGGEGGTTAGVGEGGRAGGGAATDGGAGAGGAGGSGSGVAAADAKVRGGGCDFCDVMWCVIGCMDGWVVVVVLLARVY